MSDEPRSPQLEHVLAVFGEQLLRKLTGGMPGRIASYDADAQSASIDPLVMTARITEDDARVAKSISQLHNVPVMHWGGTKARITFPIMAGDVCWLMPGGLSLERWKAKGGTVDPQDDRRHNVNDMVALVGLHDFAHVPTVAPTDALVLHASAGIKIRLGGPDAAGDVVVQSALDLFIEALTNSVASAALAPAPMAAGKLALATLLAALTTGLCPPADPILELAGGWPAGTDITKAK